jgi:hypothetical protein
VKVYNARRIDVGSCNACNNPPEEFITHVELDKPGGTLSFRLCRKCHKALRDLLSESSVQLDSKNQKGAWEYRAFDEDNPDEGDK